MKIISLLVILSFGVSCSTLNKSMIAGGLIGGILGSVGGMMFSPDPSSESRNAYMFGVLGAGLGGAAGYSLYDDPLKAKLQSPMLTGDEYEEKKELPLFDFSPELKDIKPEVNFKPIKKYEVPQEKLPKELEGKIKKQYIIEYESQGQTLELGNRTIEVSPFKAWEHVYEK